MTGEKKPKDYNETKPSDAEEAPQQPNAVLVTREFTDDGKIAVEVVHLGDVRITEVQMILELGVKRFREIALGQKPS